MNQIVKTYITIFLMLIIIVVGTGIIISALDAQRAEKTNSNYASTIAAHNFSDSVISACVNEARDNNYVLTVKKYDTNADGYFDMCECILEYDYSLSFLNTASAATTNNMHHYSRITA